MVETLSRFSIPFTIHKIIPFVGEIEPDISLPEQKVICMGSYSMRHLAKRKGWTPGVFDLIDQDFTQQLKHWGDHMLNHDSTISAFKDVDFGEHELMFLRPVNDSKHFTGKVFDREDFYGWKRRVCVLEHDYGDGLCPDTLVQACVPKSILNEHRFWVIKGKIVTSSTYKIGWTVHYQKLIDDRFEKFVEERIAEWQPAEAFVIDVCDTYEGIKIVETNTLNSSGFYAADVQKLVLTLELEFS
jgi:hypothetical protein